MTAGHFIAGLSQRADTPIRSRKGEYAHGSPAPGFEGDFNIK